MPTQNSGPAYFHSRRLSFAISTVLFAAGAHAQQRPTANADELEAVVVTGTRIPQDPFDAPTPTTSVDAEAIQLSGTTNLTDFLASQPSLTGSIDSGQTSGAQGFIGSTGLNLLNLRNLRVERTLVLVDGRRHVASLPETAAVDVNTIPEDLIERIDIVTGGVSAVYGADAVSGVVNFVMKKNFEGINGRLQYGEAEENRKPVNWLASVAGGHNFMDGALNLSGAVEHRSEGRLRSTDRRDFSGERYITLQTNPDDGADDPNVPDNIPLNNMRYFDSSREGAIDIDIDGSPDIRPNGLPFEVTRFVPPFYTQGGTGTLLADYIGDLLSKNDTTVGSVFLNWEVAPNHTVFAEAKYVYGKSFGESQPTFEVYPDFLFFDAENPFIPAAVSSQIIPGAVADSFEDPSFPDGLLMTRDNIDLGIRGDEIIRKTLRGVAGAKGALFDDYKYEMSYVYGKSTVHDVSTNNRFNDRFFAALDVVTNPLNGQPTCRSNLDATAMPFQPAHGFDITAFWPNQMTFTPGANSGCQPLNLFGDGVASRAAIDWVMNDSVTDSELTQNVFNAFVNGTIPGISLPGGPIDAVLGVEWRRETSRTDTPIEDQAGLTFGNAITPTSGKFDVREAFTEFRFPILKEVTAFELLQTTAALRVSDYSTVGSTTTWNVGATWKPIKDVGFRAMYAESVRAPNIAELFSPKSQDFNELDDPCDVSAQNNGTGYREANCAALLTSLGLDPTTYIDPNSSFVSGLQTGNANLMEETAKSYTYGVVFQPRFAPGLALAIDYYDIKIEGAISTATAQEVANSCVDQPTLDNVFCDALTRDPVTGGITSFLVRPENVTQFRTRGIDFSLQYAFNPASVGVDADIGQFKFAIVGNRLDRLTLIPTLGAAEEDKRTTQLAPKWQTTLDLTWKYDALWVNYGFNYFSKTTIFSLNQMRGDPDIASEENQYYDARKTHDMTLAYEFIDDCRVYVGVNNLTDQKPDLSTFYPVSSIGRFFFAGAVVSLGK
ncbi:MAG TPA: TonB-dependent receptor [Steroidobacteraceae bacterium]|nr:TonB-dependent receptor [Steroidobacteraceae bacterium]